MVPGQVAPKKLDGDGEIPFEASAQPVVPVEGLKWVEAPNASTEHQTNIIANFLLLFLKTLCNYNTFVSTYIKLYYHLSKYQLQDVETSLRQGGKDRTNGTQHRRAKSQSNTRSSPVAVAVAAAIVRAPYRYE